MRRVLLAICLALPFVTSCQHTTPSTNPKVVFAVTIYDAATVADDFSIALRAANDGVAKLQATEPDYYNYAHPYLVKLAQLNDKAIAAIKAAQAGDTSADWKGALAAIVAYAASQDPTTFGFKNPTTQASVRLLFAGLTAAITAMQQFGGK
jgi:hypothetical protein